MIITKDEAISLILLFSNNKKVSSKTKLNKLVARLNLFMIPIDINFNLNKYGSYNAELEFITAPYYETYEYDWQGKKNTGLRILPEGQILAQTVINNKIKRILSEQEINKLNSTIFELSQLPADKISEEEHKDLLVDPEEKYKLQQRINSVHINLLDLYNSTNKSSSENPTDVQFAALIEYCYHLTKYLKEKRFKNIEEINYDYEADMFDYYFLYILEKTVIPFLQTQIKEKNKDLITINKHYQYFVNFARSRYVFSLDNPDLKELTA